MSTRAKQSYDEMMQRLFHRFTNERGADDLVDMDDLFDFAEDQGWKPPKLSPKAMFKREMSRALSRERIKDANGNPVRPNLAIRFKNPSGQGYFHFWGEMLKMKPAHVKMSLQQRLLSIANRAIQLDRDKEFYNERNEHGAQLDLDYNLNPHVSNSKNPTEYPDERPEEDGDAQPA